jgi:hypothetical protein
LLAVVKIAVKVFSNRAESDRYLKVTNAFAFIVRHILAYDNLLDIFRRRIRYQTKR